ncbi:hypothetical protein NDU88_008138 [Pleurodeles waltl]|uniref:Uncharacterized protein n=1 Tax=Pleurodeles waltl TaxID=8319 RepID=A0AAV7VWC5_PLEWA|nr:hypothetical protein NDU88_008138 [Pleurodeles waltl]
MLPLGENEDTVQSTAFYQAGGVANRQASRRNRSSPVNPFEAAAPSYRAENRLGIAWQRIAFLDACNNGGDSSCYWSPENV